ncbi:amidohydrolase [Thermococcus sp.]
MNDVKALIGTVMDIRGVRENVAVLIEGKCIYDIIPADKIREYDVDEVFGGEGYLIIPGLINSHTHVAMTKFRGLGDDLPLNTWLNDLIWPMEKEWNRKELRKWALLGLMEAVSNGSTTVNEHYFLAGEIAKAAQELGVRAFIGQTIMDLVDFPLAEPKEGFKFFKRWKNQELITATLAPHATDTVSRDLLEEIGNFAKKENALVHIHLSQSKEEVRKVRKREGLYPVEYLQKINILDKNLIAAHGVYLNNTEIKLFAKSGATLAHCPTSLAKLEGSIAPTMQLWKSGANISLGNDCAASNNSLDMIEEMKIAAILNKIRAGPEQVGAAEVFYWATLGGARALRLKAGIIQRNYLADLVLINTKKVHFLPKGYYLSHLVYSAKGSDVEMVFVNGDVIYNSGKFPKIKTSFSDL